MNSALIRIAERRERLVAQSAEQRRGLAQSAASWRAPLALADRAIGTLRIVKRHPGWVLGAVLVFVVLRPGRAARWGRSVWAGWQIGRKLLRH